MHSVFHSLSSVVLMGYDQKIDLNDIEYLWFLTRLIFGQSLRIIMLLSMLQFMKRNT